MPGMVKIGRTARHPEQRVAELTAASGVPTAFRLEGYVRSPDAVRTEAAVHRLISGDRVNTRREFFRIEAKRALSIIRRVATDERLSLQKPKKTKRRWWTAVFHLLFVFACFNAFLSVNGFDHGGDWQTAAANASLAILLPSGVWNRLMKSFVRRPATTYAFVLAVTATCATFWHQAAAPFIEALFLRL
jgi:hypothetical protein